MSNWQKLISLKSVDVWKHAIGDFTVRTRFATSTHFSDVDARIFAAFLRILSRDEDLTFAFYPPEGWAGPRSWQEFHRDYSLHERVAFVVGRSERADEPSVIFDGWHTGYASFLTAPLSRSAVREVIPAFVHGTEDSDDTNEFLFLNHTTHVASRGPSSACVRLYSLKHGPSEVAAAIKEAIRSSS